jgi:hypothetical protein
MTTLISDEIRIATAVAACDCEVRREIVSDGREEREERQKRIDQEKQEDREDQVNREDLNEWRPERVDS